MGNPKRRYVCMKTGLRAYRTREDAEQAARTRPSDGVRLRVVECQQWHWHVHAPGCDGKRRYGTQEHAFSVALSAARHSARPLSVYQCPTCSKWHLTSHPRRTSA